MIFGLHIHYPPEKEVGWISGNESIQSVLCVSLQRWTAEL